MGSLEILGSGFRIAPRVEAVERAASLAIAPHPEMHVHSF